MNIREDLEERQKNIKQADNTHPREFANGPFIRSLFNVSEQISSTSQQVVHLTGSVRKVNESLGNLTKEINNFNQATTQLTTKANKLIWWYVILTGVIATATIISIFI